MMARVAWEQRSVIKNQPIETLCIKFCPLEFNKMGC